MTDLNNISKIFSLDKFRKIKENNYDRKENCEKNSRKWSTTNPRFKSFDQLYFHAGDMKDLDKYAFLPLRYYYSLDYEKKVHFKNNLKHREDNNIVLRKLRTREDSKGLSVYTSPADSQVLQGSGEHYLKKSSDKIFKLYKNIDYQSITNTFNYMFNKFKKGIFVIIRDNKLALFLPFSNYYYTNNWYQQTYFSEEEKKLLAESFKSDKDYSKIKKHLDKSIIDFQKKYPEQFKKYKINFNRKKWVANNCYFRNQYPEYEGSLNVNIYKSMLDALLKERIVQDVEFFINPRDFPILKKDLTEPYNHLFDSDKVKIEAEFIVDKMCPIFSKSGTEQFADILIPNEDDWMRLSNKFFLDKCMDSYKKELVEKFNLIWSSKKDKCIFRGSATGCGITLETNMRLKAANISIDYPELLDAGITDWNAKPKKYSGEPIKIIDTRRLRFGIANKIDNIEKSGHKYILNIDGHVSACRLSSELGMNSVVLLVDSPYKLWFSHMIEPGVHYILVKSDLSDLITKIEWCISHDKECKKIAENAREFYLKYLDKNGVYNYLEEQFNLIHQNKVKKDCLNLKEIGFIKSKKNIAIIACFRDLENGERERERRVYVQLMNKLLVPYCNFHIYIIEQSDDGELFNIGKLKNIGFDIATKDKKKYDHFIFTDIDMIPNYDLMQYLLITPEQPISLAVRGTRWEEKRIQTGKIFMGALLNFSKKNFEDINGYANNFWGWGSEDDSLIDRLRNAGYKNICYPKNGAVIDIEEDSMMKTINIPTKVKIIKQNSERYEKRVYDLNNWKKNGINSLQYKILSENKINLNISQIKVDLMKKEDMQKYPEWFPVPVNNFDKLKKMFKDRNKDLKIKYI